MIQPLNVKSNLIVIEQGKNEFDRIANVRVCEGDTTIRTPVRVYSYQRGWYRKFSKSLNHFKANHMQAKLQSCNKIILRYITQHVVPISQSCVVLK